MSIDAEAIADRRRLRRKLTFWRIAGVLALIAAVVALGYAAADRMGVGAGQSHVARISIDGFITSVCPFSVDIPKMDSTATRNIQPAEPVYQVQPPRPTCGGSP